MLYERMKQEQRRPTFRATDTLNRTREASAAHGKKGERFRINGEATSLGDDYFVSGGKR
jgi:hypothetical protein